MADKPIHSVDCEKEIPCLYFGFDLSKESFEASWRRCGLPPIQREELFKMKTRSYPRSRDGIEQWWKDAREQLEPGQAAWAVMEVTSSFSLEVVAWLGALCPKVQFSVLPGKRVRDWASGIGVEDKNDPIDARVLACYGAERRPPSYEPINETHAKLRALCRTRLVLVEQRVATKLRLDEGFREHLDPATAKVIQKTLSKVLRELDRQIEQLELQMKKIIAGDPQLESDVNLVDSISGVGWHTAVSVLSELGDLRQYKCRSQVVSMVGLNPVIRKSGTSVEKRPRISKKGNSRARRALYLAAIACIGRNNPFALMYNELVARGKKKMVALVAVMRKLLLVMRAVVISGKSFDKNYSVDTSPNPANTSA